MTTDETSVITSGPTVAPNRLTGLPPIRLQGRHPASRRNPSLCLLDPQTRDRSGDHELLDLLGALEDVVGLLNAFGGSGYGQTQGFSSV
jgi:hypothetical protein